ncbi:MAG TPA: hypothetical protein VFC10_06020 [Terriglobia bacterium]|jgi:polyhydroxyalkanoate synthesis regulator phasin|nr:hypothetical protein [Terriglobia bacterium]
MKYEELKEEFGRLSHEEKQRFMEEVGMNLCKEMMADSAFMDRMMPRCMEMMGQMPESVRRRMREWMQENER